MGLAVLVLLALMGAVVTYLGYRYFLSAGPMESVASVASPTPIGPLPATPEEPATEVTPAPEPSPSARPAEPVATPIRAVATAPEVEPGPDSLQEFREALTPAERRRLASLPRAQRMAALAALRRRLAETPPNPATTAAPVERAPVEAPPRPRRTRINLEVEASQPSTGEQIGALFAQVLIDNRPFRDFVIRFSGANSFARWKKVENIVLEDVPLSAREITLAVATDPGLNSERMEGSMPLSLEGEETNLSVAVRFYNQFDKSVRFR